MKRARIILTAAVLGLLFTLSPTAHAQLTDTRPTSAQKPSFRVGMYRKVNTFTMNLSIEKRPGDILVVELLDERGRVLHKDALGRRRQNYSRLLNFEEARDGTYTVVVRNGAEEITREIHLSTQTLYEMPKRQLIVQN
ncbi:hypothetical protein [Salmonirosea aquatica]|uniref:Secretion system C-terminal sorting domain-containing protein n=1 Tax=Salmonirosea aquatica TaxID=2654236 RepID=A0A7C9FTU0_9BACT|nr:hypothetical protein [Cytophagaceae bacterium SJW1-29]